MGNPLFQTLNDGLLTDDDVEQRVPVGGRQVNFPVHTVYMT